MLLKRTWPTIANLEDGGMGTASGAGKGKGLDPPLKPPGRHPALFTWQFYPSVGFPTYRTIR